MLVFYPPASVPTPGTFFPEPFLFDDIGEWLRLPKVFFGAEILRHKKAGVGNFRHLVRKFRNHRDLYSLSRYKI